MNLCSDLILALFLMTVLWLSSASRLLHCIRLTAWQGMMIALLPLAAWDWHGGAPRPSLWMIALITLALKGFLLPHLLHRAMIRAEVKRELEPLVGYGVSLLLVSAFAVGAFIFAFTRIPAMPGTPRIGAPAAFTAVFAGLFLIMARRKAITQAIGFLLFENGISLFGLSMMLEYGFIVELGILLDVFVLTFVMGIAIFRINREFSHIDTDRLNLLSDNQPVQEEQ